MKNKDCAHTHTHTSLVHKDHRIIGFSIGGDFRSCLLKSSPLTNQEAKAQRDLSDFLKAMQTVSSRFKILATEFQSHRGRA